MAGRVADPKANTGRFLTLADIAIPGGYDDMFTGLTEHEFRDDISSSQIRNQQDQNLEPTGSLRETTGSCTGSARGSSM